MNNTYSKILFFFNVPKLDQVVIDLRLSICKFEKPFQKYWLGTTKKKRRKRMEPAAQRI